MDEARVESSNNRGAAAGLVLLALAVRLWFFFSVKNSLWFQLPAVDAAYYHDWAQRIISGDLLSRSEGAFLMNPGYPYFLALVYGLFGTNTTFLVLLQYVLGAISCALVYLITCKASTRPAAIIAGMLAATYGISIFYESMRLTACLINFLNLSSLYFLLRGNSEQKKHLWVLSGIFIGLSALVRPNILIFLPILLLWILLVGIPQPFKRFSFLALPVFVMLTPILLLNHSRCGAFALTVSGGINFYIGNNPSATGAHSKIVNITHEVYPFKEEIVREASRRSGRRLTLAESSSYWFMEGIRFILGSPASYFHLLWTKIMLFWNRYEIPANLSFDFVKGEFRAFEFLPGFGLVAVLGITGILMLLKEREPNSLLLFFYFIAHLLSNLLVFVLAEYRYPAAVILMVFSGHAICVCHSMFRVGNYPALGLAVGIAAMAAIIVYREIPYDKTEDPTYLNLSMVYSDAGRRIEAIRFLESDAERSRKAGKQPDAVILEHLGIAYFEEGDRERAMTYFEEAKARNPVEPRFWTNLGKVYASRGKADEAIKSYQKSLTIDPEFADAYHAIGEVLLSSKNYAQSERYYRKAIQFQSGNPLFHMSLAKALIGAGRFNAALLQLEESLKYGQDPGTMEAIRGYMEICNKAISLNSYPASRHRINTMDAIHKITP